MVGCLICQRKSAKNRIFKNPKYNKFRHFIQFMSLCPMQDFHRISFPLNSNSCEQASSHIHISLVITMIYIICDRSAREGREKTG